MKKCNVTYGVFILWLIIAFVSCGNQVQEKKPKEYKLVFIQSAFKTLSIIDNETDEDKNSDHDTYYRTIVGLFTNDSIYIYNNFDKSQFNLYTLEKNKYNFTVKYQDSSDSLIYLLDKKNNVIQIGDNKYYLNQEYFTLLSREGHLYSLLRLLTPYVEDFYNYNDIINYLWFSQDMKDNSKILKSEVRTKSPHSDMIYKWDVLYSYNNIGELEEVKKTPSDNPDDIQFNMKLVNANNHINSYDIFFVDDGDRFSEISKLYVNTKNLSDSIYTERQQHGCTNIYTSYTLSRKEYTIDKLNLTKSEITDLIKDDLVVYNREGEN